MLLTIELKRQATIYREMENVTEALTGRFQSGAAAIFRAEGIRAARLYERGGVEAAMLAPEAGDWYDWINRVWMVSAPVGGEFTERWLEDAKATKPGDIARSARNQAAKVAPKKVSGLVEASQAIIRAAAGGAATDAEAIAAITRTYAQQRPMRSRRVAWGETHESVNYGSQEAAKGLRRLYDKLWIATPDDRVRDAHMNAHKQKRQLAQLFTVGGERLMYPGDTTYASIGNTINCRCVLSYTARLKY